MCDDPIRWKITRRFDAIPRQQYAFACWDHLPHVIEWIMSMPLGEPFVEVLRGDYVVKEGITCQVDKWSQIQGSKP